MFYFKKKLLIKSLSHVEFIVLVTEVTYGKKIYWCSYAKHLA